ncbi:pyridoxamine 5'-phosphate oxidase family protein [Halorubrum sp. Atlit-8R]|uniref:pyridoxamine 5'-phosphate oxidase family protein n=1 Tax=unclassified Halorubrum TaxID=2642239 RepID=UPI000EF29464|nr:MULTISPECIES: pyridoxamine 5'-phosphate oxidase family protein [unclassified Halorubrum]RLM68016.1 pyridoxamine 5'-phosphate oxidase family protein [Halorubrum sp. Atlit-9R]RLM81186.1 pyridoxamine 5'-phosphate oxidase family protein [Halorubrum sp. Atlit-8R]
MEHVEYVYTSGMSESDVEARLRSGEHGVLALASDGDAYATPLSYHYDGDRLLLRVSDHDGDDEKGRFLAATDTATFVCYAASTDESWSVHVRGPVSRSERRVDEATLNEWFQPFRLFDEAVEDVAFTLYELEMETVIGRATVDG